MTRFLNSALKNHLNQILDLALPPRCVVSGDPVEQQGMVSPSVWADLNFIAAPQCQGCGVPFEYDMQAEFCAECADFPPSFDRARAALRYDDASRRLILGFKHGDQTHAVLAFTPWLQAVGREILEQSDMLVPVPLHRWRLIARRYNQAALMAKDLGRVSGTPVVVDALLRHRATPPQGHLKHAERAKNVRKAFAVNPKRAGALKGKTVCLIDDVYTTGATVKECAKVLRQSGAKAVHVLTLARVVKG